MNAMPGSARAFARTVRDVINWRGQRRAFFQQAHEVSELPPIALCWGDRDTIIPIAQGRAFVEAVEGALLRQFDGCGHYLHNEQPTAFARTVRELLDDPALPRARIRPRHRHELTVHDARDRRSRPVPRQAPHDVAELPPSDHA